jgi:hypothetical protein
MALDVWVIAPSEPEGKRKAFRRRVAALEWDGYYEYVSRYWPASSSTGHLIDLYDSTYFEGANLDQLRGCLLRARAALNGRPASWQEVIGRRTHPGHRVLYSTVDRERLQALVGELLEAVDLAEAKRGRVAFEGD